MTRSTMHGHQAGDQALKVVADALRATTREFDRIARLGGDEFGALFVGVERDVVLQIDTRPRLFTTTDQRIALALAHHLAPLLAILHEQTGHSEPHSIGLPCAAAAGRRPA